MTSKPSIPPPRRYRWLARKSKATRRPRHVFVESSDFSICTYATRFNAHGEWVPDAEREDCRKCKDKVAEHGESLTEAKW